MDINENLEQLGKLENQTSLLLEARRIQRERSTKNQHYPFTYALQEAKRLHPDFAGGRPLRMAAPPLYVSGSVGLNHPKVLKSDAAKAYRKLRQRAVEIQDRKKIDFGDALPMAEEEMPDLVRTLDQYEMQTGESIFGRS